MSYAVILSKPQDVLVKELFNYFNAESYDISHLSLVDAPVAQEGPYNTYQRIAITPHPEGVDVGTATIHFNRIDLSTLFSVVEVKLREVDIKADGTFDPELILAEVQRKYGIDTSTGQFGVKQLEGQDVFYAKSTNPAFIGYSPLVVEVSLETRVETVLLNGFNWSAAIVGPGPTTIAMTDAEINDDGLYGTVASSELISQDGLYTLLNVSDMGTRLPPPSAEMDVWDKFNIDGKVLFIPRFSLTRNVSWNTVRARGYMTGIEVTIGGHRYIARVLNGSGSAKIPTTSGDYISGIDSGSEWDRTIGRMAETGARPVWGPLPDEDLGLTPLDTVPRYIFICAESAGGGNGVFRNSHHGVRGLHVGLAHMANNYRVFKPILELIE